MIRASREPLSWLVLERYALGELGHDERAMVEVRLAESADDRALLAHIRSAHVPLTPLPVHAAKRTRTYGGLAAGALGLAASLLVVRLAVPGSSGERAASKGGQLSLGLVSALHGEAPHTFTPGERFKVRVTCAHEQGELRLIVFQGGERFEPLRGGARCGENLGVWPGAFSLDGEGPADVCVLEAGPLEASRSAAELGEKRACVRLERAR